MTVYIELVFLENLIIDRFLLLIASKITYVPLKCGWLGATFGALYACVLPLLNGGLYLQKILALIIMCMLAFKTVNVKSILFTASATAASSACLFGIFNLFKGSSTEYFYEDDIFFIIALFSVLASYLLYKLIIVLTHVKKLDSSLCTLSVCGISVTALIDSGNSLYYNGTPVVIVNRKTLITQDDKLLIIPYNSLGTSGALLGFKPEKAFVTYLEKTTPLDCVIALSDHSFNGKFDALMHPDLIRECV